MITVAAGGSSSVLRNACGVSSVIRSASSRMNTLRRAMAGRSAASRSSPRIAPIRIAREPRGFVSGGVGTITCRSGCGRAELASSSSANASAVVIRPAPAGPTKAYAWATRSPASARRSSSTARGWSRMRSSATEEVLDDRAHLGFDNVRRLTRADQPHALGLGAEDLVVTLAHAPVERELFALEPIEPASHRAISLEPGGRVEVEEQGEVGHDAAGRTRVQLTDQIGIDAASVTLVRDRRVGVPVAEHDAAPVEPRPDLFRDVLLPRGHEEEDFDEGLGLDARALEQATHLGSEPCSVGLARVFDLTTLPTKPSLESPHLGRLARPLDALERDQYTAQRSRTSGATIARPQRFSSSSDAPLRGAPTRGTD